MVDFYRQKYKNTGNINELKREMDGKEEMVNRGRMQEKEAENEKAMTV